jgi:DNA-binding MarR family transcriptional regulator
MKRPKKSAATRRRNRLPAPPSAGSSTSNSQAAIASKSTSRGVAEPIVQQLGVVIRWARVRSFNLIADAAGVQLDRSGIVILTTLHRLGPLRLSDLADDIGLDRSTISRQVAAVVRDGYVERAVDENDARALLLTLTARGQAIRQKLATAWHDIVIGLMAEWPEQDIAELARLLSRLTAQFQLREDADT